jgi:hypothetical protein
MSFINAGIQTLLYTLSGCVANLGLTLDHWKLCDKGMDETIYYMKQSYQEQVRGQATLLEHPHIIDPSQHGNDFDKDIKIVSVLPAR